MSSVNYSLKHKGIRLISSDEAWVYTKKGKPKPNPKYHHVGAIDMKCPNIILSTKPNKKPKYRGDVCDLNNVCKSQIIDYFFGDNGRRNAKYKAYFVIPKKSKK